jgi:hypothetical protein
VPGDHGDRRDAEHELERLADSVEVDADEHRVGDQVDQPTVGEPEEAECLHVAADEHGDRGGRDGVLDEDGHARGEAADGAEGSACEAVPRSRHRQRRGHLGQAEDHAGVHDPHQQGGDHETTPAALVEAEVPACEVAGDDVADAEPGEEHPAGCASLELAVMVVLRVDVLVVHPGSGHVVRP